MFGVSPVCAHINCEVPLWAKVADRIDPAIERLSGTAKPWSLVLACLAKMHGGVYRPPTLQQAPNIGQ